MTGVIILWIGALWGYMLAHSDRFGMRGEMLLYGMLLFAAAWFAWPA